MQDWDSQNAMQILSELCGFVTIIGGSFLLHKTKDIGNIDRKCLNNANEPRQEDIELTV